MSRIKQRKFGVKNFLEFTNQNNSVATFGFDGSTLEASVPVIGKIAIAEASTQTLRAEDSGKTFFIDAATGASTFTLPAPAAGLTFKFIWTGDNNNAIVIKTADLTDTTGDLFQGALLICSAAAVNTVEEANGTTHNTITVDDNAANAAGGTGSFIELICTEDPYWYVRGVLNSTTDSDSAGSHFSHV